MEADVFFFSFKADFSFLKNLCGKCWRKQQKQQKSLNGNNEGSRTAEKLRRLGSVSPWGVEDHSYETPFETSENSLLQQCSARSCFG